MLLGALALAALAGVMSVMLETRWATFRIMWTGILTAVGCLLTLPLARLLDRRTTRDAGLLGLCVLVVEYLLVVSTIWLERLLPGRLEEKLAFTALMLLLTGILGFLSMLLLHRPGGRWASVVGLTGSAAALAGFMLAIWLPGRVFDRDEWWGTGWVIGGCGAIAGLCLIGVGVHRRPWRWIGVIAAVVTTAVALIQIWDQSLVPRDEHLLPLASAATLVAVANLLLLAPLRGGQRWLAWGVLATSAIALTAINIEVVGEPGFSTDDLFVRIFVASGVVTGCGAMAIALLVIFNRRADVESTSSDVQTISLFCPRCRKRQTVDVGRSTCGDCGLRFDIRVEEPRCGDCGYLLWGVSGDRCPECGAPVGAGAAG